MARPPKLILASASPRRQKLLGELGLSFEIAPAEVDETPLKGEPPREYVRRVAAAKACAVATKFPGAVVLSGDTTVCLGRRIFGKAADAEEAAAMLARLVGRRHRVYTAMCLLDAQGNLHRQLSESVVKFVPMRPKDIQLYVQNEENWRGKAGSYSIGSTAGARIIAWMSGSPSGVLGMPLAETVNLLKRAGYDL